MFVSFTAFGLIPILGYSMVPMLLPDLGEHTLFICACLLTALALLVLGAYKAHFSDKAYWQSARSPSPLPTVLAPPPPPLPPHTPLAPPHTRASTRFPTASYSQSLPVSPLAHCDAMPPSGDQAGAASARDAPEPPPARHRRWRRPYWVASARPWPLLSADWSRASRTAATASWSPCCEGLLLRPRPRSHSASSESCAAGLWVVGGTVVGADPAGVERALEQRAGLGCAHIMPALDASRVSSVVRNARS